MMLLTIEDDHGTGDVFRVLCYVISYKQKKKILFKGVELSGVNEGPSLSYTVLSMTIEDESDSQFKPGFPYRGRVCCVLLYCFYYRHSLK